MTSTIAAAALAGLMGSPHCVAMCGGFATACARPRRGLLAWHAGRLTTYATLGALAGATGAALPGPAWLPAAISIALLAWFAAALAGVAPQPSVRLPALARIGARLATRPGPAGRFLLGLTTGLLPCGMVYAALGIAVAAAHPAAGAAAMLAFGLGTVPALAALSAGVQRLAARSIWHRRALALLVLAAGLWSVAARVGAAAHPHGAAHPHWGAHPGVGVRAGVDPASGGGIAAGTGTGAGTARGPATGLGAGADAGRPHRYHAMPAAPGRAP